MDLEITVSSECEGRVTVVQACGFIDGKTAPDFQDKIIEVMQEVNTVLIDLAQVGFVGAHAGVDGKGQPGKEPDVAGHRRQLVYIRKSPARV